ncbi:MAG: carboxypeptidase-like regulatory domain-containing protein [Spirochaetia bacterium]|nr:carboxypeptidase-like regulatory domain-containing protein [Spirochaetia bacterium]
MKNIKKRNILIKLILPVFMLLYCGSDTATEEENLDLSLTASISGTVTTESGLEETSDSSAVMGSLAAISTPSGVTVEVFEIDDSGNETAVGASVTTNEDGSFSIEVEAGKSGNYIVVAKDAQGNTASTIVDGTVSENEDVASEPMTETTTAQVEIFRELKKSGEAAGCFIHPLALKDNISPKLAEHLSSLASDEARSQLIGILAHGICKLRFAKVKALESLGISIEDIRNKMKELNVLRKELNLDLNNAQKSADKQTDRDTAFQKHIIKEMQLYLPPSPITLDHETRAVTIASKIHSIFDERYIGKQIADASLNAELGTLGGYRFAVQKETAKRRTLAIHRYISHLYRGLGLTLDGIQPAFKAFMAGLHAPASTLTFDVIMESSNNLDVKAATIERVLYVKTEIETLLDAYRIAVFNDLKTKLADSSAQITTAYDALTVLSEILKAAVQTLITEDANYITAGNINLIHLPQDYTQKYLDYYSAAKNDTDVYALNTLEPKLAELLIVLSANRF